MAFPGVSYSELRKWSVFLARCLVLVLVLVLVVLMMLVLWLPPCFGMYRSTAAGRGAQEGRGQLVVMVAVVVVVVAGAGWAAAGPVPSRRPRSDRRRTRRMPFAARGEAGWRRRGRPCARETERRAIFEHL
jgi:peptidoglycan/LPS O-acetylase OafA/YrhL